jgi:hypothetical protein
MSEAAFQLRELRFLVRGLKAYGRRRTPRTRQLFARLVRATYPREVARRRQLAAALPAPPATIPDETGILEVTRLFPSQIAAAVDEANEIAPTLGVDRLRSEQPGRHLYPVPLRDHLGRDSAILRLALDPGLLRLVSDYLGTLPVIENIYLWFSPNEQNVDGSSQFHHLDGQDVRTLQLFVNIEDVDEDSGPLTALSATATERIAHAISYRKNEIAKRVPDEIVERYVDEATDVHVLAGPSRNAWIVDTDRCFHYGSRAGTRPRRLLVLQYYSPFAFVLPRRWSSALPFAALAPTFAKDEVERCVLGAD